ncbi:NAD(P)/FAD-dependent oxidoreductase [Brevundimonas sp.]|uniref:NAD(P)/FAD-dependent oxidoreductase n=1 Tax=Brevundimonas sp. TaxID=1871086 RepID=UPI003BAD800D
MDRIDAIVIGAGVVGLAIARALAQAGREVLILERHGLIGSETSARNSEVIHAGIYYPQGSLKARLCVAGRTALYDFCRSHHVPHRQCGKLIVAPELTDVGKLSAIRGLAQANGVEDLTWLDGPQAVALEPGLRCAAALMSPSTGIIDSHAYMLALLGDAEDAGAVLALNSPVEMLEPAGDGVLVRVGGAEPMVLMATTVVNSAGLSAPAIAATAREALSAAPPTGFLAKGSYFSLTGRAPFSRLIYPTPEPGGLGVHLTLDMGGQARFGPDVEWIDHIDYDIDPSRGERFYAAVRAYWPALADGALAPAYTGIRPKISGPGEPAADFRIDGPSDHGVAGLINLYGIESPGLTSSLALADLVLDLAA